MDYTFTVKRSRQSVTQGCATVYLNGEEIITFGDTIEMIKPGQKYYGTKIGDYASTEPDEAFIRGVLWHPFDNVYHYSKRVKEILNAKVMEARG